jgi:hypothetical protein
MMACAKGLVQRRFLDAVDDDDLDGASAVLQLEPELLLYRCEEIGPSGSAAGGDAPGVTPPAGVNGIPLPGCGVHFSV